MLTSIGHYVVLYTIAMGLFTLVLQNMMLIYDGYLLFANLLVSILQEAWRSFIFVME